MQHYNGYTQLRQPKLPVRFSMKAPDTDLPFDDHPKKGPATDLHFFSKQLYWILIPTITR